MPRAWLRSRDSLLLPNTVAVRKAYATTHALVKWSDVAATKGSLRLHSGIVMFVDL